MKQIDEALRGLLNTVVGPTNWTPGAAAPWPHDAIPPVATCWPNREGQIAHVLQDLRRLGYRWITLGAGTRSMALLAQHQDNRTVAIVTRKMNSIEAIHETSLIAKVQAGISAEQLEKDLRTQGLTLGFPSLSRVGSATIGGLLALPSSLTSSPQIGSLVGACVGISLATVEGKVLHTRVVPRRSTGPDLARLLVGSGDRMGIITSVDLTVRRIPEQTTAGAWAFPELSLAHHAARAIVDAGLFPAQLRILVGQTAHVPLGSEKRSGSIVVAAQFAGPSALVTASLAVASRIGLAHSGKNLSSLAAQLAIDQFVSTERPLNRLTTASVWLKHSEVMLCAAKTFLSEENRQTQQQAAICFDQFSPQGCQLWFDVPDSAAWRRICVIQGFLLTFPEERRSTAVEQAFFRSGRQSDISITP